MGRSAAWASGSRQGADKALGGQVTGISIGGGCTEVSHTGTVAYGNHYSTLDAFTERCLADLEAAEAEAKAKYGIWFSSLDYHDILLQATLRETALRVEVGCFAPAVTVRFDLGTESTGFWYLTELVRRFGRPDYDRGAGADRPFWDEAQALFQRTYQLDEAGTWPRCWRGSLRDRTKKDRKSLLQHCSRLFSPIVGFFLSPIVGKIFRRSSENDCEIGGSEI